MKRARAAALIGALMVCMDTSGQKPEPSALPPEAQRAIEQTPCPEAAGISPEACLLWLSRPNDGVNADRIARDLGRGGAPDGAAAAVAESQRNDVRPDGLRGRSKD